MSLTKHLRREQVRELAGEQLRRLFASRFGERALADPTSVLPDCHVQRLSLPTADPKMGAVKPAPWYVVTFNRDDPIRCAAKSQDQTEAVLRAALLAAFDGPEDLLDVKPLSPREERRNREREQGGRQAKAAEQANRGQAP